MFFVFKRQPVFLRKDDQAETRAVALDRDREQIKMK
jgi:hypothetical protein